jgi:cytochrome c peroxidase
MRGDGASNELAAISDAQPQQIWRAIMDRLGRIREYRELFEAAYPGKRFAEMNFAYASNAIAAFIVQDLTFNHSPWDRFLAGSDGALTAQQLEGARSFLTLKCSQCHNGPTFSDDRFHDVAVAQIGPGQGEGLSLRDDYGRENVTGDAADRYRFRTTPLRNVELTAPYGHDGAYASLRDFVEHYSDSDQKLLAYDPSQLEPDLRGTVLDDKWAVLQQRDPLLDGVVLSPELVDDLTAYLESLTDPAARDLSLLVPDRVPSGLPVNQPSGDHGEGGHGHGDHDGHGPHGLARR